MRNGARAFRMSDTLISCVALYIYFIIFVITYSRRNNKVKKNVFSKNWKKSFWPHTVAKMIPKSNQKSANLAFVLDASTNQPSFIEIGTVQRFESYRVSENLGTKFQLSRTNQYWYWHIIRRYTLEMIQVERKCHPVLNSLTHIWNLIFGYQDDLLTIPLHNGRNSFENLINYTGWRWDCVAFMSMTITLLPASSVVSGGGMLNMLCIWKSSCGSVKKG